MEGDVDRKFTVPFDEFLGSVQRVYYPQLVPVSAFFERNLFPLFAEQGIVGLLQGLCNDGMRFPVGNGQWGIVRFLFYFKIGFRIGINGHDFFSGFQCGPDSRQ